MVFLVGGSEMPHAVYVATISDPSDTSQGWFSSSWWAKYRRVDSLHLGKNVLKLYDRARAVQVPNDSSMWCRVLAV